VPRHCKETILESASVCPACKHHVRFAGAGGTARPAPEADATLTAPAHRRAASASRRMSARGNTRIVVSIRNEAGKEIGRKLIGVGAMAPDELRTFNLSVEVVPRQGQGPVKVKH
jgi:hypothetical protein